MARRKRNVKVKYHLRESIFAHLEDYINRYLWFAELWGLSMAVKPPTSNVVLSDDYDTNQIYSTGVEFAMVGRQDKKWKQAMTFVFCKDFLHDTIWAMLHKKPVAIYDFSYNPTGKVMEEPKKGTSEWYTWSELQGSVHDDKPKKDIPIHMGRTALLFRDTTLKGVVGKKRFHDHRLGALDFLHQVDKQMGFNPTQIYQVKGARNGPPTWLILGDKRWMHAPTLLSLYSILIRVGYYHNPGGAFMRTLEMVKEGEVGIGNATDDMYGDYSDAAGCNDTSYVKQAWKGIEVILKHGIKVFHDEMIENYPEDVRTSVLHDKYGIVNFTKRHPAKRMPHWYRKSLWK
ncbi:hypothetical protein LCGC14_1829980 [marine sediment metagenome]|uniref:Uncharacterized protein n=1 Tax=marine sediment metagenome TaxID=412755 RepID=A0A0F9IVY9_9ZZZZ